MKSNPPLIPARDARRLFLAAQALYDDPTRRVTAATVQKLVERLGFVQVDSIQVVDRAHHLTLASRLDGYRPKHLTRLLELDRSVFEHWTHDASVIPTSWYPHWKWRFERDAARIRANAWWTSRAGGDAERITGFVRDRIAREGALCSADFEHDRAGQREGWWGWSPQKAALEYLWRAGEIAVVRRVDFQKYYDLAERVFPTQHAAARPSPEAHVDWACVSAMERLGVATPREIAFYWHAVSPSEATAWCAAAVRARTLVRVQVGAMDDREPPREAYAVADWAARLARLGDPPDRMRLLSPFDPVVRDRARALRWFGVEFRFEAYVPAAKRQYGYYVMPVLDGDAIVARVDPKYHRDRGELEIRGVWWEPGVRPTRVRRARLDEAVERLAESLGAERVVRA